MTGTDEFDPVAGRPVALAPDLTLVVAPNPSPMTHLGTNSYVLGRDTLAVIDPGPADADHLHALRDAIAGRPVSHIFVTHSHLDHSPLSRALSDATGAPVCAFGACNAGRSKIMQVLAGSGLAGGGEGIDHDFAPDHLLRDGDVIAGEWGQITAIHTPGHIGNHLCFRWGDAIFTGDHVMGWASSLVSPPDGDLTDFMASCAKLLQQDARIFYAAHGAPIADPTGRLTWLITHRQTREAQILGALTRGPATPMQLAQIIYKDTPPALRNAAARNVFAHLVDLHQKGKATTQGPIGADAIFAITGVK